MSLPIDFDYPVMEANTAAEIPAGEHGSTSPSGTASGASHFAMVRRSSFAPNRTSRSPAISPELVAALRGLKANKFVLDGEIAIQIKGELSFDDLLMRIHPAESRIRKLAAETPSTYYLLRSAGGWTRTSAG